jgi:hypothetical protein
LFDVVSAQRLFRSGDEQVLGGLPPGTLYAAGDGTTFSKTQVPICLSHHAGPLQEDKVVERPHRSA